MRELKRWAMVAVVATAWSATASAQLSGSATSGSLGGLTTGGTTGGTGGGTGGINAGSTSGGGQGGGSGNTGSQLQGSQLQQLTSPPDITAPTGNQSSSVDKSNFLSGFYGNPYYQGLITSQSGSAGPGGFGQPLFNSSGSARGTTGGTRGGATNRNATTANQSGIVIPLQVQMAYAAEMRFASAPVPATQLSTELRVALDGTSMLPSAKGVQIVLDAGNNVTLRGSVADEDERRLAEGLVRMTPGVRAIKNELVVSKATASK